MAIRKQTWIQRNLGKLLFGGAVAVTVIYALAVVAGQGDSKGAVNEVSSVSKALKKRIDDKSKKATPPLPKASEVVASWKTPIPAREDLPLWLFNREPEIKVIVEEPVDTRPDLFAPIELSASVTGDFQVELNWKADARTTAPIEGYDVLRWKKGEAKPEKPLADRLITGTAFTDADHAAILPLTSMMYAVRVHTKADVKQVVEVLESAPFEVAVPDDRTVLFHGGGSILMAVLYVKRFCRGEWREERFSVNLGEPVGAEKLVTLDDGPNRIKVDFGTGKLLVEIGEEKTKEQVISEVPKRDEKGRQEYDEDGNPIMEKEVREIEVIKEFVVLSDEKGAGQKIWETKKVAPVEVEFVLDEFDPHIEHVLKQLGDRLKSTKDSRLKKNLRERIKILRKNKKKLMGEAQKVDDNLLNDKDGLLYKLRWEWLEKKDMVAKFPKVRAHKDNADIMGAQIKDLETFLSPEGWDKEKDEWDYDRGEFQNKVKFEGRPPALWVMPERPKTPRNHKPRPKGKPRKKKG
jgi:hypothetical protein